MNHYENKFVLKQITKSSDEDYIKALQIYMGETPKEIRTNSNEITSWLDKKNIACSFEMLIFILYLDGELIGFSQITYIQSQQIVILDYISLKSPYRVNSVFLVFLSMIQNFLAASGKQITYYIAEIGNKDNGTNIDRESAFYKRIICLENYGKLMAKYYNLPLGIDNYESEFESLMYIKTNDNISYISKETFLGIVHSICYEYYYVWYAEFLNSEEIKLYKEKLDKCYNDIKKQVAELTRVDIEYTHCTLFYQNIPEITFGAVPAKKKTIYAKTSFLIIAVFILPIVLTLIYNYLLERLNIQFGSVSAFVGNLISICTSAYIAFHFGTKK